ncbi:MAG: UDP-N-acetylmuramate dehydrogenase [Oscillospiraceae bacterium]|nr:UDP-N-acetylmuramate dehydrogenase [Oscillospiraceae bacterium]
MTDSIHIAIEAVFDRFPAIPHRLNEPMKNHTSFKIGGTVRSMFFPDNAEDLIRICKVMGEYSVEPLIVGNGTNLLVDDKHLDIVAIKTTSLCAMELVGETGIKAGAGVSLSRLAAYACQNGLSGMEFSYGIPGALGGAVAMNAGAYGGEMKDVVYETSAYSQGDGKYTAIGDEHGFAYRRSIFSSRGGIALGSVLRLQKAEKRIIQAKMDELNARRREKQPLDLPSAGSVFKRPERGHAAFFIEQAGLKGYCVGGAQVSEKHSGFIVNQGEASFSDVMTVIDHVMETVMKLFGVELELEVKIIRS